MPGPDTEADLRQAMETLEQYEVQIRAWSERLDAMAGLRHEISSARATLAGLQDQLPETELLVPVGHDTSLFAKLDRADTVLTGLGSRVFVEAPLTEAVERLENRLKEVDEAARGYSESLGKLQQEHGALTARVEALYATTREAA